MPTDELKGYLRRRRAAPERTLAFVRALDPDATARALEEANELARDDVRDSIYRIFHTSWKMYYLRDEAVALAALMFAPLGGSVRPTKSALVREMRRWHLDETFVEAFSRTASTLWSAERNEVEKWRADATQLVAGFAIMREVALASLEAIDRLLRKDGFLFHPKEPLDSTDALFLEVWSAVGLGLRYARPKGLEEECRKLLRSKRNNRGRAGRQKALLAKSKRPTQEALPFGKPDIAKVSPKKAAPAPARKRRRR